MKKLGFYIDNVQVYDENPTENLQLRKLTRLKRLRERRESTKLFETEESSIVSYHNLNHPSPIEETVRI